MERHIIKIEPVIPDRKLYDAGGFSDKILREMIYTVKILTVHVDQLFTSFSRL